MAASGQVPRACRGAHLVRLRRNWLPDEDVLPLTAHPCLLFVAAVSIHPEVIAMLAAPRLMMGISIRLVFRTLEYLAMSALPTIAIRVLLL